MSDDESVVGELPSGAELNKPFRNPKGSGKKFSVYVKNDKGNIVKVGFGDPDMEIRRDDKEARKNFRARHQCDTDPGPKWKARYWSCRMWDEEPVSKITAMRTVTAAFSAPSFDGSAPESIVFFPKGVNTVNASMNGEPCEVTVNATQELASFLNSQLQQARLEAQTGMASRPFLDFDHEREKASAIPTEIYWDEDKGIMCSVEWTKSGRDSVEGKDYSYFSPEFVPVPNGGASLKFPGPIGGLVNTPAFQTIGVIAANHNQNQTEMKSVIASLKKFGVELSADADETAVCSALEGKLTQVENDLTTAKASLASYENQAKETAAAKLAQEADSIVSAALADGKIKDKGVWVEAYKANPKTVTAQLADLPAKKDGHDKPVKTVTAGAPQVGQVVTCSMADFRAMTEKEKFDFSAKGGRIKG